MVVEILLRIIYFYGIWWEYQEPIEGSGWMSRNAHNLNYEKYHYLGEDIDFWYSPQDPLQIDKTQVDTSKKNIAILWDSVANGSTGWMTPYRFSTLLNQKSDTTQMLFHNFAIGGQNISEVYAQYMKFANDSKYDTVIYVYDNNDRYYEKVLRGNIFNTVYQVDTNKWAIVIHLFQNEALNAFLSRSYLYDFVVDRYLKVIWLEDSIFTSNIVVIDYSNKQKPIRWANELLIGRFNKFVQGLKEQTQKNKQRFIVIISPTLESEAKAQSMQLSDTMQAQDTEVYDSLKDMGVEVYNMYDEKVQEKNYFIDNKSHLNQAGNTFYADFILKVLTSKVK